MTTYALSSINNGYEQECVAGLPSHMYKLANICVIEPLSGFNRTITLSDYTHLNLSGPLFSGGKDSNTIDKFEIDFLGHTKGDFNDEEIHPLKNFVCDDNSTKRVLYSNFIEKSVPKGGFSDKPKNLSPDKENFEGDKKYVLAEITYSVSKSAASKKLFQLERTLPFLKLKLEVKNVVDCIF